MAEAPSTYDTIEDSTLYFWFPHHTATNRDATKGKKESEHHQQRDATEGKKESQQCHFQKRALLQFCDLSDFWFIS